jgi:predicted transposase YdaD
MHHPEKPNINSKNDGIKRASEILDFEQISPSEWEQSKIREGRKKVQLIAKEEGVEEGKIIGREEGMNIGVEKGKQEERDRAIRKAISRGKLTFTEIAEDFGVSIEFLEQLSESGS